MTQQDASRSYDDLPESDVATVLQVPLLWTPGDGRAMPGSSTSHDRRKPGRHRAAGPVAGPSAPPSPTRRPPTSRRADSVTSHHLAATARVGLISAALVLALFAAALLALAAWLP